MFSIADIQNQEEFTPEEAEGEAPEELDASYPLRCSLTVTKVRIFVDLTIRPSF